MIDEQQEELASLYAFDLIEGAEKAAFEQKLAASPELRRLVDELRATTAQLAHAAPRSAPSPTLRTRILASAHAIGSIRPSSATAAEKPSAEIIPFPLGRLLPWGIAAAFILGSTFLFQKNLSSHAENVRLQNSLELTALETKARAQQLEAERILSTQQLATARADADSATAQIAALQKENGRATQLIAELRADSNLANLKVAKLASLLGNTPEAVAIAVWDPRRQQGILTVEKLPALATDQDYQLWVIDPAYKDPVNGGVFTVDANGTARLEFRPDQNVTAATTFAVSRERKGGVVKAEGPLVLAGTL